MIIMICPIIIFGCGSPEPEETSVLTIHNSLDLWELELITLTKTSTNEISQMILGPISINEYTSIDLPRGDYTLYAIDSDNYEYNIHFTIANNPIDVSISVSNSTDFEENTYENNLHAQRVLASRLGFSQQEAQLYASMAEAGMFDGIEGIRGLSYYYRATEYFDAACLLSYVTEASQGYRESQDHGYSYQVFLDRLESSGTNYCTAIDSLDPYSVLDHIVARNIIAQSGFGEDYAQLSTIERNYVDEIFHANDVGNGPWATIQDEMLENAMYIAVRSADSVSCGSGQRVNELLSSMSRGTGISASQIEAYAAWSAAIESGAYRSTVTYFRNQITDFEPTQMAYGAIAQEFRNAQGQILAPKVISALANGTDGSLTEDEFNEVWMAFRDDGRI